MLNFTISGTAQNGGKARTLLQRRDLAPYGFGIGERYNIVYEDNAISLMAWPEGDRKVSRVTDRRRGFDYATIDLRYSEDDRQELFGGAERLNVEVSDGIIVITAA